MTSRMLPVTLVLALACAGESPAPPVALRVTEARALPGWMDCAECTDGELDSVLAHRAELQDALIAILRAGVPPDRRSAEALRLGARHERLARFRSSQPGALATADSAGFIAFYLERLDRRYRLRAGRALAALATPAAIHALAGARDSSRSDSLLHRQLSAFHDSAVAHRVP